NNVAPTILTATNLSGSEGKALSFSATFSDPGVLDTHTASINWGDGTSGSGKVTESGGNGSVAADHTYADNGTYTITLRVTDDDGGYHEVPRTATITNAVPVVTAAGNLTFVRRTPQTSQVASFTDLGFTFAPAGTQETFTSVINWGDNTPTTPGTLTVTNGQAGAPTSGTPARTHTYAAARQYTITITITDDDGGSTTVTANVVVLSHGPKKFLIVDQADKQTFRYDKVFNTAGTSDLTQYDYRPRGVATTTTGDTYWVIDARK